MLTPQEVSQHAFAKASFGGYNMSMVDEFLDALTEDYTTLYKENQVLKSKMKVLVDKVEEYRATDDSMRKAFLVAQRSAEDIVAKAEAEREDLIRQAEGEARAKVESVRRELEKEQQRLAAAQAATAAYVENLRELCRRELAYLDALPRQEAASAPTAQAVYETAPAAGEEIPEAERTLDLDELRVRASGYEDESDEEPEEEEETEGGLYAELLELGLTRKGGEESYPRRPAEDDDEPDEPTRRFDNLQFGKDYEIR